MKHQLDFWPAENHAPYEQSRWESLSIEDQGAMIARLALLIANTVCPQVIAETPEDRHEQ